MAERCLNTGSLFLFAPRFSLVPTWQLLTWWILCSFSSQSAAPDTSLIRVSVWPSVPVFICQGAECLLVVTPELGACQAQANERAPWPPPDEGDRALNDRSHYVILFYTYMCLCMYVKTKTIRKHKNNWLLNGKILRVLNFLIIIVPLHTQLSLTKRCY